MSKYTEAIKIWNEWGITEHGTLPEQAEYETIIGEALEIADRVSQINYMEMPTPKVIETEDGVKANTNILEAVEVITHNNLLAKIKGEEERIYAK